MDQRQVLIACIIVLVILILHSICQNQSENLGDKVPSLATRPTAVPRRQVFRRRHVARDPDREKPYIPLWQQPEWQRPLRVLGVNSSTNHRYPIYSSSVGVEGFSTVQIGNGKDKHGNGKDKHDKDKHDKDKHGNGKDKHDKKKPFKLRSAYAIQYDQTHDDSQRSMSEVVNSQNINTQNINSQNINSQNMIQYDVTSGRTTYTQSVSEESCGKCKTANDLKNRAKKTYGTIDSRKIFFKNSRDRGTIFIYWDGKYNSTFRICQLLSNQDIKKIQPIYILGKYHRGKVVDVETALDEIATMNVLRGLINQKFHSAKGRLLETVYSSYLKTNDPKIKNSILTMRTRGGLNDTHIQYQAIAEFSIINEIKIEVCSDKIPIELESSIHPYDGEITKYAEDLKPYRVSRPYNEHVDVFKTFLFPFATTTKQTIVNQAKNSQYDRILNHVFTCNMNNGRPCGECHLCMEKTN
jgi:hypothetical protein